MSIKSLPGLNVQAPWARLLLDGRKTIETRTYPLPAKYVGKDLWLIETPGRIGKFKARVIGTIRFSGSKQYPSASAFAHDFEFHLVRHDDPNYSWQPGIPKFGWTVELVKAVSQFDAPFPRGIVYSSPFTEANRP